MKTILLYIWWGILYFLYFLLTIKERTEYMRGESKGMDCIGSRDVSMLIPGHTTEFTYDPTKPPTRRYTTWKEFIKNKKNNDKQTL